MHDEGKIVFRPAQSFDDIVEDGHQCKGRCRCIASGVFMDELGCYLGQAHFRVCLKKPAIYPRHAVLFLMHNERRVSALFCHYTINYVTRK
jgi:hypothetical protein